MSIATADPPSVLDPTSMHAVRNSLGALRLMVEALRDGLIPATPDSGVLDQMMSHVRLLSEFLDGQTHSRETRY